jgi:hypothetical protein
MMSIFDNRKRLKIVILLCVVCLTGCRGVSYSYHDEDSTLYPVLKVPAGAKKASFEFGIVTNYALPVIESDYPTISAHYGADSLTADRLKKLDVKLFVDGAEIAADETKIDAGHFNRSLQLTEPECCEMLGKKLGIGENASDADYPFGVSILKKYKSLKRLPPQVTVVLSAVTDKGGFEMTKIMTLTESEDSNFIRVH